MAGLLSTFILGFIWFASIFVATLPLTFSKNLNPFFFSVLIAACIFIFAVSLVLLSGFLTIPFQRTIIPGTFPRSIRNPVYLGRRIYGLCWTNIFYFPSLYFLILSVPLIKTIVFRLFGYRGHKNFTIYPDTWTRDLPLLSFREGAYIANKSTLGTNVCLQNGDILVGPVRVGQAAVVGHLAVIGLGSTLGDFSELGVGATTGIRVKIGRNTQIAAICGLNHGCQIGSLCEIGAQSYIGLKAILKDGIKLPAGTSIPDGAIVETQKDADQFRSSQIHRLQEQRNLVAKIVAAKE